MRVDQPVYFLPIRFTARRGSVDIESCQFVQGNRSLEHLAAEPVFYRMPGDAIAEAETEEILQALLSNHLRTEAARPHVRASMPHMDGHLQRFRALLDRVAAVPVTLQQGEPVSLLLVCVPAVYVGDQDYLVGSEGLSMDDQLRLYSRQQEALRRLSTEAFTLEIRTNHGQEIRLPGQLQRVVPAPR